MKKIVISTIVLIIIIGIIGSIMLFFNNEQEYENGVTITGSVKNTDESNVSYSTVPKQGANVVLNLDNPVKTTKTPLVDGSWTPN